ncbi:MAG: 7-cyano-7-deazaguanine synthase [Acidobacteriota bacterium]|nr:7-cyano-7-deazaguanine synthase [Blastocatellia bacterium]MDW8413807.1 7-cyano-7-deazaguanine synthase [Acidobacteriota bacterium]
MTSVTACVSGGIDSCVMLAMLSQQYEKVYPVFLRNGYKWEEVELGYLRRYLAALNHPNIESLVELPFPIDLIMQKYWGEKGYNPTYSSGYSSNYIPGRNMLILNTATVVAFSNRCSYIALGLLAGNPYPDAQKSFFDAFEQMVWQAMHFKVKVLTPLIKYEKHEVIKLGRQLPLELSFSCVFPQQGLHCGSLCNKCAERQKGFFLAGIPDPTAYANTPPEVNWYEHEFGYD